MPVVGHEQQVFVAVGCAPARHVPGRLQGCLAQQRAAEGYVLPAAPVDVSLRSEQVSVQLSQSAAVAGYVMVQASTWKWWKLEWSTNT